MTDQTAEERAHRAISRKWYQYQTSLLPKGKADRLVLESLDSQATHLADNAISALTAAGIALVDAAELDALLTFAAASRKEYVWRRCGEEARLRQGDYRPEQMEQWEKQYAELWDDEHSDVAAIMQRRNEVTND